MGFMRGHEETIYSRKAQTVALRRAAELVREAQATLRAAGVHGINDARVPVELEEMPEVWQRDLLDAATDALQALHCDVTDDHTAYCAKRVRDAVVARAATVPGCQARAYAEDSLRSMAGALDDYASDLERILYREVVGLVHA